MAEQAQQSSQEQTTSTEQSSTTEQTLDQVYEKYNVDQMANEFRPQVQQQTQQQQVQMDETIPDPVLDATGFKGYLAKQSQTVKQTLAGLTQFQQQLWVQEQRRREEADIKSAVSTLKSKFGDEGNGIEDDAVEIALGMKARRDPKFKTIWQNRYKNPMAWNAALGAVANEFKGKLSFRADPQLAENVRAAKQSTQSSQTAKDEGGSDNAIQKALEGAKSERERAAIWSRMVNTGL